MSILTQGATRPPHLDTLKVRHGFAFIVDAVETIAFGGGRRERNAELQAEQDGGIYLPAGRGE